MKKIFNAVGAALFFTLNLGIISCQTTSDKTVASKGKAAAATEKEKDIKKLEDDNYSWELSSEIIYKKTQGEVKLADQESATKLSETSSGLSFMTGYLLTDHIEPFLETRYVRLERAVAEFGSSETLMDVGLGAIVNLPQPNSEAEETPAPGALPKNAFSRAKWIPYVGILFGTSSVKDSRGNSGADPATVTDGDSYTKFMLGTRWMIYPHVSLNFSMRLLYEKSKSAAALPDELGAERSKLKIETQLLSMSLFL